MHAIDIKHATIGTVSSREDGSVAFRVMTPELRPSEKGEIMEFHGRAVRVLISPDEGEPDMVVTVDTEREGKSQAQRMHSVLYLIWKHKPEPKQPFDQYYSGWMERAIDKLKEQLPKP